MHYKNGREAKAGDPVIYRDWKKELKVGIIHSLNAGAETCNGNITTIVPGMVVQDCVTVAECLHAEDANAAMPAEQQV